MAKKQKAIYFVGSSQRALREFSEAARMRAGHELLEVERGGQPSSWRPMPDVGDGVVEIKIDDGDAYRVFYVAKFESAIYVLHAFQKTTRKTDPRDIKLGRARYREAQTFDAEEMQHRSEDK